MIKEKVKVQLEERVRIEEIGITTQVLQEADTKEYALLAGKWGTREQNALKQLKDPGIYKRYPKIIRTEERIIRRIPMR